jgi:hypothetical protein
LDKVFFINSFNFDLGRVFGKLLKIGHHCGMRGFLLNKIRASLTSFTTALYARSPGKAF